MTRVYYRISDKSQRRWNLSWASRERCFANFITVFGTQGLTIIADNCSPPLREFLKKWGIPIVSTTLGNAGSFRYALDLFLTDSQSTLEERGYFVEDDYIHKPDAPGILEEGLAFSDYVTLYDHPDKYSEMYEYGEISKVMRTESCHWKSTCSTCMTFAVRARVLKQDRAIWYTHLTGELPDDHMAFMCLGKKGRLLCSPMPSCATHTREGCLSPLVDWKYIIEQTSESYIDTRGHKGESLVQAVKGSLH